jgi:Zn-dependent peptidase ImmA (M78 family)
MTLQANTFRAKLAAADLVKNLGITAADQIRINDIAMSRGVYVKEDVIRGADSWLIRQGERGLIRVNTSIRQEGRKRFAVGHEIGHWELHQGVSQAFLCTEGDVAGYTKSTPEIEANVFSAELLMPTSVFGPLCQKKGDPNLAFVLSLAERFQTTLTASAIRYVDESQHTCALVFSDSGTICWWKKKESWKDFWLDLPESLPEHSAARRCLEGRRGAPTMELVDPQTWLSTLPERQEVEIHEQSVKLGDHPWVLTLLWIVIEDCDDGAEDMWSHFHARDR